MASIESGGPALSGGRRGGRRGARRGGGSRWAVALRAALGVGLAGVIAACGSGPPPAPPPPVTRFECPRDKLIDDAAARQYPAAGLPSVWAVLEDREKTECWEAGLRIAGYAATDDAFARLRGFIEHRAQTFALSGDQFVLQRAVEAIGNVVRVSKDPTTAEQALEFLIEGSNPETWAKRSTKWPIDAVLRRELIRLLSRASVKALSVTERPEAYTTMRTLAVDAVDRRSLAFKFTAAGGKADRVEELINLHVLPPGRVAFAMDMILTSLRGRDYGELRRLAREAAIESGRCAEAGRGAGGCDSLRDRIQTVDFSGMACADLKAWGRDINGKTAGCGEWVRCEALRRPIEASVLDRCDDLRSRLREVQEGCDDLRIRVRGVRDQARETFALEQEWLVAARGNEQYQQAVRAADAVADSRLSGFHGQLDSLRRLVDDVDGQAAIEAVSRVIFPRGPLEIIQMPYRDQVDHALAAMRILEQDYAAQLESLRLAPHVRVVVQAHEELLAALSSGQQGEGYQRVLDARARLQTRLRVLVAAIIDRVPGVSPPERRLRSLVLGPVMDQNAVVDNFMLRSEPIRDVDPETGQEIAPPEEGGEPVVTR